MEFPIFKTKMKGVKEKFDLSDAKQREKYFDLKAGEEIKKLRAYLKAGNSFVVYLLGKKNSGKGTYAKMFKEIIDKDRVEHFSIGDMIREIDGILKNKKQKKELITFLEKNYRGYLPLKEIMASLEKRSTKTLLSSELILTLVKKKISEKEKKAIFLDGFPRDLDQVSYSLFFRDLIGYRDDPDLFVLVDVPEKVIDERIKYRVVCPLCQTSRNTKLLATKNVGYDKNQKKFYLICDNSECKGARMVQKEGDEQGIEPIRDRLIKDGKLIDQAFNLCGVPKVLLRNSVPVDRASKLVDDYELTPEYSYEQQADGKIKIIEKPWQVADDDGDQSFSLMPPPVVVSMIKQISEALGL